MGKRIMVFLLMLLLTACQSAPALPTPIGTVTRPDLVALINWERSPLSVVFRAEAASTDSTSFLSRTEIADCTIYGDNRVVYTAPTGTGSGVNWQVVNDEAIRLFVEDMQLNFKFYNQRAAVDALPVEQRPEQPETLTLVVNGQAHRADSLGGWPDDFYHNVTERCRAVADSPAQLLPAEAYVSVEIVPYNDSRPTLDWSPSNGIDLAALSLERTWLSGGPMQALWIAQRNSGADVQVQQGDNVYNVAIEVPGVTRYSPLPP